MESRLSVVYSLVCNTLLSPPHVLGLEGGRSQGQVTSSSEIGLASPLGQQSNKELAQGEHSIGL